MAAPALVELDRIVGSEVAQAIWKNEQLRPLAALWFYDEDAGEWRFIVATNEVRARGPRGAYLRMRGILKRAGLLNRLPLRRVVLWDPTNPVLDALRHIVRLSPNELSCVSVYDSHINAIYVAGAVLYFLTDQGHSAPLRPAQQSVAEPPSGS